MSPTVTVKGYDANNNYLGVLDSQDFEQPALLNNFLNYTLFVLCNILHEIDYRFLFK